MSASFRSRLENALLRRTCRVDNVQLRGKKVTLYRTRILGGPLRGSVFFMPRLERASFVMGTYEHRVVRVLKKHISPGSVVYDVGANAGYLTLVMAKLAASQGNVHAFEADPKNIGALEMNLQMNGVRTAVVCPKAVTDFSGTVRFAAFDYSLVGHIATETEPCDAEFFEVESISLDDWVYGEGRAAPRFLKIDVEGAELDVVRGAERILTEVRPVVLCEVRTSTTWDPIERLMTSHRYVGRILEGQKRFEAAQFGNALFTPG